MFNQYKYQYILQVDVNYPQGEKLKGNLYFGHRVEYAGATFDEIDEEFRKDYNIPDEFKLKSEFEFEGNSFRLRYLYWGSRKDVFDPFDEWEDEE